MKLELIAHTPHTEELIAAAALTTTSGRRPSAIFHGLLKEPERVRSILSKLEVQHGSILDHGRVCWRMDASDGEVLDITLRSRFFSFTRLGGASWLVSSNLRTALRYAESQRDPFAEALAESLREIVPSLRLAAGRAGR